MAKIICLKIKRRGDFFRLGAQILRRFMGFYSLTETQFTAGRRISINCISDIPPYNRLIVEYDFCQCLSNEAKR